MKPTPRQCECPGCEEGWHRHENPSGDPRGSAIPPDECSECRGTGTLHVYCAGCNDIVPWHTTTLDEETGEYQCSPCHREACL